MTCDELTREFLAMKALGWQITEEPIRDGFPYNTRTVGWRVLCCMNGISIDESAPFLAQARQKVWERAKGERR